METKKEVKLTESDFGIVREKMVRIVQVKAILDANKPLYNELDKLTLELRDLVGLTSIPLELNEQERMYMHGGEVKFIEPQQVVTVNDNFSEKNVVFRPAGVKRFEADVEPRTEYDKRLAKIEKNKAK